MPVLWAKQILNEAKRWPVTSVVIEDRDCLARLKELCADPVEDSGERDVHKRAKRVEYEDLLSALGYAAQFLWNQRATEALSSPERHKRHLVVLASTLSELIHDDKTRDPKGGSLRYNDAVRQRLAQWFWSATFSSRSLAWSEVKAERDALLAWCDRTGPGRLPSAVDFAAPPPADEIVKWRFGGREYRAVTALLSREDPCDLLTGERIAAEQAFAGRIDGHHLFPKGWAKDHGRAERDVDLTVNAAAITRYTNVWIKKQAPSECLARLDDLITPRRVTELLAQHHAPEEAMRTDDWPRFRDERSQRIKCLIKRAIVGSGP